MATTLQLKLPQKPIISKAAPTGIRNPWEATEAIYNTPTSFTNNSGQSNESFTGSNITEDWNNYFQNLAEQSKESIKSSPELNNSIVVSMETLQQMSVEHRSIPLGHDKKTFIDFKAQATNTRDFGDIEPIQPTKTDIVYQAKDDSKGVLGVISENVNFGMLFDESWKGTKWLFKTGKGWFGIFKELLMENILFGIFNKKKEEEKPKTQEEADKKKKEMEKKRNTKLFFDKLASIIRGFANKMAMSSKREEINKKVHSNNLSYEGRVNDQGQIRLDVEMEIERINSEMEKEQIKKKRKQQLAKVNAGKGKSKKGPGVTMDLNKSIEDPNNVTKLLG